MPTIIDELIMTLGFRDDGFTDKQKQVDEGLDKTKRKAAESGKELEFRAKRSVESFSKFRDEVIALFTVFTAGIGLKNFINDTVRSEANLGRMSHALDTSVETLSQWQGVLKRNGGTAEDATGAFRALADIIAEVQTTGTTSKGGLLTAMGVTGGVNQLQDKVSTLMAMVDRASHMDPQTASFMLRQIGFSEAMVNVMLKGRGALQKLLDDQKKLGVTTDADVAAAQRLQDSQEGLKTAFSRVGAMILTALEPAMDALAKLMTSFAEWAQHNQPIIVGALTAVTVALGALGLAALAAVIEFSPILGPMIIITAGALAAGAAIGALYEGIVRGFHAFMNFARSNKQVGDALEEVIEAARNLWSAITDLLAPLQPVADAIGKAFGGIGKAISDAFGSASLAILKGFVGYLVNSFHAIADIVRAITALLHGDIKGALQAATDYVADSSNPAQLRESKNTKPLPGGPTAAAPGTSVAGGGKVAPAQFEAELRANGIGAEQAKGITAGAYAESNGLNPNAINPKSGAFGIGQWLGARKAALFRRFGPNPTLQQQVQFLVWELKGGDRGGKAVLSQNSASAAMQAYIKKFMRPGQGAETAGDLKRGGALLAANSNVPPPQVLKGAQAQYATAAPAQSKTDNHIQIDKIEIVTQATDAPGIAKDIGPAVKKRAFVQQVNAGLG